MKATPVHHQVSTAPFHRAATIYPEEYDRLWEVYAAAVKTVKVAFHRIRPDDAAPALMAFVVLWNKRYFDVPRNLRGWSLAEIELAVQTVLRQHWRRLTVLRARRLEDLRYHDEAVVVKLFTALELPLGAVGAAKCLHVLAPDTFPLWDRKIAAAYGLPIQPRGKNSPRYLVFMGLIREQCEQLTREGWEGSFLKILDQLNYCKFTKDDWRFTETGS